MNPALTTLFYTRTPSPIGMLLLTATRRGLSGLYTEGHAPAPIPDSGWTNEPERFSEACSQLEAYFRGALREFRIELDLHGTAFQLLVWDRLQRIPYGQTTTYGEIARGIGRPKASRAVGAANGRNPVSIIVPCHRVVGQGGSLTGYAGGLERKRMLLDLESRPR